jgi:hypothetical protein
MTKNKLSPPPDGFLHSIHIHDIAFPNNYGVGKTDDYVLFVPRALLIHGIRWLLYRMLDASPYSICLGKS